MASEREYRATRQRQVILEELRKVYSHPTADEIYERVRKRLPRISLGTVYRNLEMLSEHGLIQKLELGGSQRRFDGNPQNHYHVRCMGCGKVEDVMARPTDGLEEILGVVSSFNIVSHRLEFVGLCPGCSQNAGALGQDILDM